VILKEEGYMADLIAQRQTAAKNSMGAEGYFEHLITGGALTDDEAVSIQERLFSLLARQTGRFTMGDSSSVRTETAEALLRSVCFTLGVCLKDADGERQALERLKAQSIDSLFGMGQEEVKRLVQRGRIMLQALQERRICTRNRAYNDTVNALPEFFRRYDMLFLAHEIPCDIDYQLFLPVGDLGGIEYMLEYMRHLAAENAFCLGFPPGYIERLLHGMIRDADELLINIFEPVFNNAVGLRLLHADIRALDITPAMRERLAGNLKRLSPDALPNRIAQAADSVCEELHMESPEVRAYIREAGDRLADRLARQLGTGGLEGIFVTFRDADALPAGERFADGKRMDDEALRELIEEMRGLRYTTDKVAMVKMHIRSVADLTEVLGECFEDGEYDAVFRLLEDAELQELVKRICDKKGEDLGDRSENALFDYLRRT
jgi:hypothetical protein